MLSTYDGTLKEVRSGSSGELLGRLCGVIDLVVTTRGGILRMLDGVLLALESFKLGVIAETWLHDIHFLGLDLSGWFVLDVGTPSWWPSSLCRATLSSCSRTSS
jgi:hypothetical protein